MSQHPNPIGLRLDARASRRHRLRPTAVMIVLSAGIGLVVFAMIRHAGLFL